MKKSKILILLPILFLGFLSMTKSQNVGINTNTPAAALDVNGDLILRPADLILPDVLEQVIDVNGIKFSYYRISGPTADFEVSGVSAGMDGRDISLFNRSGFTMILHAEDPDANPEDRLLTPDALDLLIPDRNMINLFYDAGDNRWVVKSTSNDIGTTMGWDTSGTNLFYENNVGIGTSDPISPLTIQTDVNETGLTQIGGVDSITLSTEIHDASASIGTMSDHVFSLTSGGVDQLHLWPDGSVVLGQDPDPLNLSGLHGLSRTDVPPAKLTLETGLSNTGWVHVAGDNEIIVDEAIGQSSASIGTTSNNTFRIKSNNIGRLHVWYGGQVVVGTNEEGPVGQFTVYTPDNTLGLTQVGGQGQILSTKIGGSSAGVGTFTNHKFRLFCNGEALVNLEPNGNVGVGAEFPTEKLTVVTPNSSYGISHRSLGGIFLATHVGEVSASIGTESVHNFRLTTSGIPRLNITYDGNVGIGTINPQNLLDVNGTMRAKEIVVELVNWPDYVFGHEYQLTPLDELEQFISTHHHLPNIPSAAEIETEGQHVGTLQQKMMEKIEELTLHIIELNNRIEALEKTAQ